LRWVSSVANLGGFAGPLMSIGWSPEDGLLSCCLAVAFCFVVRIVDADVVCSEILRGPLRVNLDDLFYCRNVHLFPFAFFSPVWRSDAAPYKGKIMGWESSGTLGCGFARPGANHGHPSNNRV